MKKTAPISMTLAAVLAALYAVGVVILGPISFQVFQVRLADALLPLSMLFGWPAILGLALGTVVANVFGGLGPIDIVGGSLANLIAGYVAWRISLNRRRPGLVLGAVSQVVIVTAIVGGYLSYLFGMPLEVGLFGVLLGSVVAIGILGSLLVLALSSEQVSVLLRPHGVMSGAERS
jgi:uncharacterized membrane protein